MIEAAQKNETLLADLEAVDPAPDRFHLWWLGQSGFLVQWQTHRMLFDPYLSDSLTRKYADTDKPHVRMTERCVIPEQLNGISVATSSHNHTDHLDAETLLGLCQANPDLKLVLPQANIPFAQERLAAGGPRMVGLNDGETIQLGPFSVTGVAAAHNELERDAQGCCLYMGFLVEFGAFCVYHSGDTLWHKHLVDSLVDHDIDLMLLPINGNKPERRVAGNLNGSEAAALARACGATCVVPCHYDMFEFNTETPEEFERVCRRLSQSYRVMRCGERFSFPGD